MEEEANSIVNAYFKPFKVDLCPNKDFGNDDIDTVEDGNMAPLTTYDKAPLTTNDKVPLSINDEVPLSTKDAVKFLLDGTLKNAVCRYCLKVVSPLSKLDQVMQVAGKGAIYKVTIRNMIASFHPVKVLEDPNFPSKICDSCLDRTISSYLFTQQCEQSERALRNCFDDMYDKLEKLDPIDRQKKRGRQKLNPNYNVLHAEHHNVIDYADPVINIVNTASESITVEQVANALECPKCWQVLPTSESLISHEKTHPKTMWYNCRLCGKSFAKRYQFKRHMKFSHVPSKKNKSYNTHESYKCNQCWQVSDHYNEHLQHIEKHKFKAVMEHLIERKMDKLCCICLDRNDGMVNLDNMVCFHGGCPELTGDRSLYNILGSTLPEMNTLHNYTGTKICEKCLKHAITSYIFIHEFHFVRNRLNTCVSIMLTQLNQIVEPHSNIFVEISQNTIMSVQELVDENLLLDENDDIDDTKLKYDVLEDEFRIESESEGSESDIKMKHDDTEVNSDDIIDNPAKNVTKTYINKKLVNGYQLENKYNSFDNICSEFLTFKKRIKTKCTHTFKFTCPLCNKHFITEYFLKKHVLKHIIQKVQCTICDKNFKSKFCLYEHKKMTHLLNENSYSTCKTCGRKFLSPEKFISHVKKHKKKTCQLCDKVFRSQTHYDSHVQRHLLKLRLLIQKRAQTCSFCEKEYSNYNELSIHVNKIHLQIKPHSCDMCDKLFYTEYNLNSHKRVHSMYSQETCQFCSKTLNCRKQLVIHVRKHIGVKPYSCKICTQSFFSQLEAKKHMKQLHGGSFCCKLCKIAFPTKKELKEHVNMIHNFMFNSEKFGSFDDFISKIERQIYAE